MAASKTKLNKNSSLSSTANGYVFQPFGAKSVALIYKYNLQSEDNYKKLINSFERITSLPDSDPRKDNLIELWVTEFNRIFKDFWEQFSGRQVKKAGIAGWKDRLDVKDVSQTPDQKRQDLLGRLTPGQNSQGRKTKEEILKRAGFQNNTQTASFNFLAEGKTGQNIKELENLLDVAEENGLAQPTSLLSNDAAITYEQPKPFSSNGINYDSDGYLLDDERERVKPDPKLADFVGVKTDIQEQEVVNPSAEFSVQSNSFNSNITNISNTQINSFKTTNVNNTNISNTQNNTFNSTSNNREFIIDESMTRQEFNEVNHITPDDITVHRDNGRVQQPDDAFIAFDLETGTFNADEAKKIREDREQNKSVSRDHLEPKSFMVYTEADEIIDPTKRNIVSKEGFEIFKPDYSLEASQQIFKLQEEQSKPSKPYHEIKPIGDYQADFDYQKRPTYKDMLEANEREDFAVDELQEKIQFLRDLRSERRHRINMMKIERANSFLITRTKRLTELRENKRFKRRDDLNLRAISKADKLRRAQERQKIIQLMKERQLKRSEEKRVATVLRMERERRLERDAKYRSDVAGLDAQIRHEQELIKRTELKMKAYFSKTNNDKNFEKSLSNARSLSRYVVSEEKADKMLRLEQDKRDELISKISKKFTKNVK